MNETKVPSTQEQNGREDIIRGAIESAASFEALYSILDELGNIEGGEWSEGGIRQRTTYTADEIKSRIEAVVSGRQGITFIPRASGLRERVASLIALGDQSVVS